MPRKKKEEVIEQEKKEPEYVDYDVFNEEVAKAVSEGRIIKVGNKYRVFNKK